MLNRVAVVANSVCVQNVSLNLNTGKEKNERFGGQFSAASQQQWSPFVIFRANLYILTANGCLTLKVCWMF